METNEIKQSIVDKVVDRFFRAYNQPGFDFDINVARVFVCAFLIWKLLSRDFGFFAHIPESVFYFYPYKIYSLDNWVLWTGLPVIQDFFTMHWVHWFFPHPNETFMRILQGFSILLLLLLCLFGKGRRSIILISAYFVLIYLWGYLILLGQEIDSVDLYFGMLLALACSNYNDVPIWKIGKMYRVESNVSAGRAYSNLILVIVFYYFASGTKKLTDLSFLDWFRYDLIEIVMQHGIIAANSTLYRPDV